jgi:uncharacterized protein
VQTHYRPLRLNVGFLLSQTAGYSRQFDFREEGLVLGSDLHLNSFSGHLLLNRTPQGIVAQGDFTASIPAECARCLEDFVTPVALHLEELFVYPPQNATDPMLIVGEDAHLDLEPLLREFVIVNQPTRPLCRPDCKGLCPVCGNDLNESDCRHPEETPAVGLFPALAQIESGTAGEAVTKPVAGKTPARSVKTAPAGKKKSGGKPAPAGKKKPVAKPAPKKIAAQKAPAGKGKAKPKKK